MFNVQDVLALHEAALVFRWLTLDDLKRLRCSRLLRWAVGEFTRGRKYIYRPRHLASWQSYALCRRAFGDVDVGLHSVPRLPVLHRLVQIARIAGASIKVELRNPDIQDLVRLFNTCGATLGHVDISSSWGVEGDYSVGHLNPTALLTAGLGELIGCRSLDLSGHLLVGTGCLARLPLLERLTLRRCQLVELNRLSSLQSLVFLDASYNACLHDRDISGLTGLTDLSLKSCDLRVLTSLAGLTRLERLAISDNGGLGEQPGVDPLAPLAGLPSLSDLSIADCKLQRADVLTDLRSLRVLNADRNRFGVVTIPSTLTELDIQHCMQLRAPRGGLGLLTKLSIAMASTRSIFSEVSPTIEELRQATTLQALNVSDTALNSQQLERLLDNKKEIRKLAITGSYVGGVRLPLASHLTCVNFDCTDLGRALLETLAARGQPMVLLTALNLSRQLVHIQDMAALANALRLLPALKEIYMARSMGHADGVQTVLEHAPKDTIIKLNLSENSFCANSDLARHALAGFVKKMHAYENRPTVMISDPDRTPYSIGGPPYAIVGGPLP
jgi:hypothetical protein